MSEQSLSHKERVAKHKARALKYIGRCDPDIISFVSDVIDLAFEAGALEGKESTLSSFRDMHEKA